MAALTLENAPGGQTLIDSLQTALRGRFPQTVLLCGNDSADLKTLATIVAEGLLCESDGERPCGSCLACRKVVDGAHPDLSVIDEEEALLKVEVVRQIKSQDWLRPTDGPRHVTIIHHAQNLTESAQNALLKELEEPPAYAFFILTSERPDNLLPTVRSRCTRFTLKPPEESIPDEETVSKLAPYLTALAAGREDDLMLAALAFEKTSRRLLPATFGLLQTAIRDAILLACGLSVQPLLPALQAETTALSRAVPVPRLLRLYDFLSTLIRRAGSNAAFAALTCALTSDMYYIAFL